MARVPALPTYDGPKVQEQALTGGFQDAGSMTASSRQLGALGRSVMQASDVVDAFDLRNSQEEAFKMETQIKADWLQADAQLRKQYRGGNVEGYQQEVDKWWNEAPGKYGNGVSERAKNIANRSLANAKLTAGASALRYYEGEKEKSLNENFQAAKVMDRQLAITDGSEGAVVAAAQTIARRNVEFGATRGWSTEQVQAENLRDMTALHTEFLGSIADKNPQAAKAYFDKFKDQIDSSRHARITTLIDGEIENHTAAASARELVALPVEEAVKRITEIKDPQLQKKTELAWKQLHGLQLSARVEQEKAFSDKAWQLVASGQRVPEGVLAGMDGRERAQLQDYLMKQAEHRVDRAYTLQRRAQILADDKGGGGGGGGGGRRGSGPKTDRDVHAGLWKTMVDDPETFKTLPLEAYRYQLSTADFEQLMTKQQAMRKPGKTREDTDAEVNRQIKGLAAQAKIKGPDESIFHAQADAAFSEWEATHGKKPTREDRQKILDRMLIEGEVSSGSWWKPDRGARYYQLKPSERQAFVEGTVPSKDRSEIERVLKQRGLPVTPDNVLDMYQRARSK